MTSEATNLQERLGVLEACEAIRKLKFKYWWTMDNKLWDEFADCFTEDLEFELGGEVSTGRDALLAAAKDLLDRDVLISAHHGHQSDITVTSATTANALWALRDVLIDKESGVEFKGRGYYDEQYRKDSSGWKIARMKLWYISADSTARQYVQGAGQLQGFLRNSRDF